MQPTVYVLAPKPKILVCCPSDLSYVYSQFKHISLINEGYRVSQHYDSGPFVVILRMSFNLFVADSGPAAPADSGCPQKCRCHCVASPPRVTGSGSGWGCSCWLLAYSACSCSTCMRTNQHRDSSYHHTRTVNTQTSFPFLNYVTYTAYNQ